MESERTDEPEFEEPELVASFDPSFLVNDFVTVTIINIIEHKLDYRN